MNKVESKYSFIREGYSIGATSSVEAERLAMFLTSTVISPQTWKEWLDNLNYNETCGRLTCLIKRGNKVHIYRIDDDEENENTPSFETSIENLKYILDRWAQVLEEKPKKVIITQDDNDNINVTFEN